MSEDPLVNAKREYQRRLTALHAAQAELAAGQAALHRLAIQRPHLEAGQAAVIHAELSAECERVEELVKQRHTQAKESRARLRLLTDSNAEPDVLFPPSPTEGFEQPPFQEHS